MQNDKENSFTPDFADGFYPAPVRGEYAVQPVFDPVQYWAYLDAIDATDDEKQALLQILWDLMARFVELGFGVDPVQTVIPALIKASMTDDKMAESGTAYVQAGLFNRAAKPQRNKRQLKENNNE